MADLNQAYAACPPVPNGLFGNDTEIDFYCTCIASVKAQNLGLSTEDLAKGKTACTEALVSDRRMWRWVAAGGVAVAAWTIWRRR